MKVLWLSNAPWTPTGYGQQTRIFAPKLNQDHDVALAVSWGHAGGMTEWEGMRVYPQGYDSYGNDIVVPWTLDHFQGDTNAGWLFILYDAWVFKNEGIRDLHNAVWVPVDHDPLPPITLQYFRDFNGHPVAMSKFGQDKFFQYDVEASYIPHGFDPVFEPKPKTDSRAALGIPDDAFVVGMNAANKGIHLHRKGFSQAFEGFARFAQNHSDAILYVHSESTGMAGTVGWDLERLAVAFGIEGKVRFTPQPSYRLGIPTADLPWMYSAFDVFLNPAYGEGFGIPVLEAQACGVPVVVTDHTAMSELCGVGWRVDGIHMWQERTGAFWKIPDPLQIAEALQEAHDGNVEGDPVAFAAGYAADKVYRDHMLPVFASLQERIRPVGVS